MIPVAEPPTTIDGSPDSSCLATSGALTRASAANSRRIRGLAGGNLFGLTGVLLALPVAAVILVLLKEVKVRYQHSELYDEQNTDKHTPIIEVSSSHNDELGHHDGRESP